MPLNNLKGIVLRMYNRDFKDQVIILLQDNGEKVPLLLKSSGKVQSKKKLQIELGNLLEVSVVSGYAVPIIKEVVLIDEFSSWKKDYDSVVSLQLILEIVDHLSLEGHPEESLYSLLISILKNYRKDRLRHSILFVTMQSINITGHMHHIFEEDVDEMTLEKLKEKIDNNRHDKLVNRLTERSYKVLKFISQCKQDLAVKIDLEDKELLDILSWALDYCEDVTGKKINCRKIFNRY